LLLSKYSVPEFPQLPVSHRAPLSLPISLLHFTRHLKAAYQCLSEMAVMNEYLTFKAKYLRGGECLKGF